MALSGVSLLRLVCDKTCVSQHFRNYSQPLLIYWTIEQERLRIWLNAKKNKIVFRISYHTHQGQSCILLLFVISISTALKTSLPEVWLPKHLTVGLPERRIYRSLYKLVQSTVGCIHIYSIPCHCRDRSAMHWVVKVMNDDPCFSRRRRRSQTNERHRPRCSSAGSSQWNHAFPPKHKRASTRSLACLLLQKNPPEMWPVKCP